eukprot:CAMPEP_0116008424 /NCGR_PEP_ID=MMETSP0321-20121206/2852_1 /TAXON_ID=163516 /ORGANISM="Leptocylindrus danicus var. danicus, Strain B650" /LENGTH=233 /DNA_ID=CAMNT_0003477239 /DNA_START=38 /DNA_END=739 /DNA_ORIENTATION=-
MAMTYPQRFMESTLKASDDGDSSDDSGPAEVVMFVLASIFVYFFCCFPIACRCFRDRHRRRSRQARLRSRNATRMSHVKEQEVISRSEEEVMQVLSVRKVEKDVAASLEPCIICLDGYEEGDEVCSSVLMAHNCTSDTEDEEEGVSVGRRYNCEHTFHRHCILQWLRVHDDCPVCRRNLMDLEMSSNSINESSSITADDNSYCSSRSAARVEENLHQEESNRIDRLLTISLSV